MFGNITIQNGIFHLLKNSSSRAGMNEGEILDFLEELAGRLALPVRHITASEHEFGLKSGVCKVRNVEIVLLDERSTCGEKIEALAEALRKRELGGIYMPPAVRLAINGKLT